MDHQEFVAAITRALIAMRPRTAMPLFMVQWTDEDGVRHASWITAPSQREAEKIAYGMADGSRPIVHRGYAA